MNIYLFVKRLADILCALCILILSAPLLLFVSVVSYFALGSPILFYQERPGLNEKIFRLVKFRTMKNIFESDGSPAPDSERLSRYGMLLRNSSIDELPSLLNVIKGDMSIIGPRPLLVRYLPYYTERQRCRHRVRPGVTGLAQVMGRNNLSWEDKFEFDVEYVTKMSLAMDLKIFYMTLLTVLFRKGISGGDREVGMQPLDQYLNSIKKNEP